MSNSGSKATITITKRQIVSVILGLILSVLLTVIIHRFSEVSYMINSREMFVPMTTGLSWYSLDCPLGKTHRFDNPDIEAYDLLESKYTKNRLTSYVSSSFKGHWLFILAMTVIFSVIIFYSNRIRIQYKSK